MFQPPRKASHHEKASTPTLEKLLISAKILNTLGKFFNSLEVTSRTPPMRKFQFHPSGNNLKPSRKNLNLPEKFLPPSLSPRKLLNHASLKQPQTIELNLNPSQKISTLVKKYQPPTPQKISTLPENFSIPLNSSQSQLK